MTSAPRRLATLGLTLLVAALGLVLAPPSYAADDASDAEAPPLLVRLTGLSPSVIPSKGPIMLSGSVTNSSDETWADINVHALTSAAPITSRDALDEAAQSDPNTTYLGPRLTSDGSFVNIGDLPPGSTSSFQIKLKRSQLELTGDPGVYWMGVQALGSNQTSREVVGKARTLVPLVPPKSKASAQLVLPLRQEVRRATDGSVYGPNRLASLLGPNGRLGRITALAGTATGIPLTWVVDPALLEAAGDLADDNPPLSLGNGKRASEPSSSASPSPSPSGNGAPPPADLGQDARSQAATWLKDTHDLLTGGNVLALPFADPDVSRLSRRDTGLLERARGLSNQEFTRQQLDSTPVVAPPDGYLDPAALGPLGTGTTLLLTDHGHPASRTFWSSGAGQPLVLADSRTSSGGPLPTPLTALGVRQRILADAALTAISGSHRPLVVELPAGWDPGLRWSESGFFSGLRVPWLTLQPLGPAVAGKQPPTYDGLRYPAAARAREPGAPAVAATRQLAHTATVLDHLLDTQNDAGRTLTGAALGASSYEAGPHRVAARTQVSALNSAVRGQMDKVRVLGTQFVTLSGGSGSLNVALVNGLDQPVTVGLVAHTGNSEVRIDPYDPISLGPGQRSTLRLHARAGAIGVHEVTLQPVTTAGEPLGTPFDFSLRTSQVGKYFWAVLVAGGVLLAAMILRRIQLRLRSSRWRQ